MVLDFLHPDLFSLSHGSARLDSAVLLLDFATIELLPPSHGCACMDFALSAPSLASPGLFLSLQSRAWPEFVLPVLGCVQMGLPVLSRGCA